MKTIMLIGNGHGAYRGHMLERIARRYRIVLASAEPASWELPHIVDHAVFGRGRLDELFAVADGLAERHDVAGVLTYHEPYVEAAALVAERLGVARCKPSALARCRDKLAGREALRRAGVPSARCVPVRDLAEATAAAARIGYPVVVKPRALAASFGVSMVAGPAALPEAFRCARGVTLPEVADHTGEVLIEEYLDGPEISVDSAVVDGELIPLVYARKTLGYAPYFEELGHIVAPAAVVAGDDGNGGGDSGDSGGNGGSGGAVVDVLRRAHHALGVDNVVTHSELRLTAGGPRVVEVNGRSAGDLIPLLGELALGIDLATVAADLAVGRRPATAPTRHGIAGIRFFYPPADGRVRTLGLAPDFGRPPWLHDVVWLVEPGTVLTLPPTTFHDCRLGFAIVTAGTERDCARRLDLVDAAVTVKVDPAVRPSER